MILWLGILGSGPRDFGAEGPVILQYGMWDSGIMVYLGGRVDLDDGV